MKGIVVTHQGAETIAGTEVLRLLKTTTETVDGAVLFDVKTKEELFRVCYQSQSAINVSAVLAECSGYGEKSLQTLITDSVNEWIKDTSYKVVCMTATDVSETEYEKKVGALVDTHAKKSNLNATVKLKHPEVHLLLYVTDKKTYLCVDFSGIDLSKRSYRVFTVPYSLKGTIGYALCQLAGVEKKKSVVDTFSIDGSVVLEAVHLCANKSVRFFDRDQLAFVNLPCYADYDFDAFFEKLDKKIVEKGLSITAIDQTMKNIALAKKNAKIANVSKLISFSRNDIRWLDTKLKENTVDCIVTKFPTRADQEVYAEFFHQVDYVVKNHGVIACIGDKELITACGKQYGFSISETVVVHTGQKAIELLKITR